MTGSWTRVQGRCRCGECGALVEVTWRYYATPTTATKAVCEPCVEQLLNVR